MLKNEDQLSTLEDKTPFVNPGNYSPVTVTLRDTLGVIFMGILSCMLLIGWMRAESRYRGLINQLRITDGNHSINH